MLLVPGCYNSPAGIYRNQLFARNLSCEATVSSPRAVAAVVRRSLPGAAARSGGSQSRTDWRGTENRSSAKRQRDTRCGRPGAASPSVTGENLRGNLGASRAVPSMSTPATPSTGVPNYSFQTPQFGSDLSQPLRTGVPPADERREANDLILPRFRAKLAAGTRATGTLAAVSAQEADGWRYRYSNGRWWYWKPNNSWAFWDGSRWLDRAR